MEGLLARWALAVQEYEFTVHYRRGNENETADALSRKSYPNTQPIAATSQAPLLTADLREQQFRDLIMQQIHTALSQRGNNSVLPQGPQWRQSPLSRYKQLLSQLLISNGIVCRCYAPNPQLRAITVPLIPASQCSNLIKQQHDAPLAGHLGCDKTIAKVRQLGYWVGILQDIDKYCRECIVCQCTKPPSPVKAPLTTGNLSKW